MGQNSGFGQLDTDDWAHEANVMEFIAQQVLARAATMKIVQVVTAHPGTGSPPGVGSVDVVPLVQLIDGQKNVTQQATIFGIPVFRLVGGKWQIIADPIAGDIGLMICADRDSSAIINKIEQGTFGSQIQQAPPGSFRKYNLADGVYLGGLINASSPAASFWLKSDGTISITDADGNVLSSSGSGFSFSGNLVVTGNITATGDITAGQGGADQVTLQHHTHSGVTTGGGTSGPPTPGT